MEIRENDDDVDRYDNAITIKVVHGSVEATTAAASLIC